MSNDKNKRTNFSENTGPNVNGIQGRGTTKISKGQFSEGSVPLGKSTTEKKQGK